MRMLIRGATMSNILIQGFSSMYLIMKIVLTSGIIVLISELAKKSTFAGALLASVPVISIIAILWLYAETKIVAYIALPIRIWLDV